MSLDTKDYFKNIATCLRAVAVPGFDLRGAWTLSTGGGRKSIESVVDLNKSHFSVFGPYFY